MIKTISALFLLSIAAVPYLGAETVVYQFTVDTTSLSSDAANLDFQMNPSSGPTPGVTAVISNLLTDGTYNPANIVLTGDATGLFPGGVTLNNTDAYNDAYQSITLGTYVSFLATFSGPGIDIPSDFGTTFAFSIYDGAGTTALLTTSADGTIAGVNADSFNGVAPFTNGATVGGPSAATVGLVQTPEPASALLIVLGIGAVATLRRSIGR